MKKRGKSFWLLMLAALLSLAGAVLLTISNAVPSQGMQQSLPVIAAGFAGAAALGFCIYGFPKLGDTIGMSAVALLGMVCMILVFCFLLANRVPLVINLATWDRLNKLGWTAFYTGAAGAACDLVGMIILSIAMFGPMPKRAP